MTPNNKRAERTVLALINQARESLHYDKLETIPLGARRSLTSCPVACGIANPNLVAVTESGVFLNDIRAARAMAIAWDTSYRDRINTEDDGTTFVVETPFAIRNFIQAFDRGKYPHLERKTE